MTTTTLYRNARLIDGIADQPIPGASILVEGERIRAVEHAPTTAPAGAGVVDLTGKTVVPGLIDTHVHTTLIGDEGLALFLAAGVTTAKDVGGNLAHVCEIKAELANGKKLGPRLFICGPLLDGSNASFPAEGAVGSLLDSIPSPEAVPDKVGELLRSGVDGVKIYFTMPPETARAVIRFVDGAVPVTGHLGYTHSLDAIEAGIDGLEHVWISPYNEFCALDMRFGVGSSMMDPSFWSRTLEGWEGADLDADLAQRWFGAMVERQVNMGTTLDLLWTSKAGPEGVANDPDRRYVPPAVRARQEDVARALGDRPDGDAHSGLFDPYAGAVALEKHQEVTHRLHRAGGLVVGGTDCGAITYPPPGFSLLREIELLAEAIGNMQALQAVTQVAARYLRCADDIGSVTPGRYADFLIVDGDPLRDPRDLRKLDTVVQRGVAHDPRAILAELPQAGSS